MHDHNGGYDEEVQSLTYDGEEDYSQEMMEVQPDIILEQHEGEEEIEQFDSIVEEEGVDPIYTTQS